MNENSRLPEEVSELRESQLLSQAEAFQAGAKVDAQGNVLFSETQKNEVHGEMVEDLERRQEKINKWREVFGAFNFVTKHFPNSDTALTLRNVDDIDMGEERYRISDDPEIVQQLIINERGEVRKIRDRQIRTDRNTSNIHITELSNTEATAADLEDLRKNVNLDAERRIARIDRFFEAVGGPNEYNHREATEKNRLQALQKQTNTIINAEIERLVNLSPEQHERRVFDSYVQLMKEQILEHFRKGGTEANIDWLAKGSELRAAESEFQQWFNDKEAQHELAEAHKKALEQAIQEQQHPLPERIKDGWHGGHDHLIRRWKYNEEE